MTHVNAHLFYKLALINAFFKLFWKLLENAWGACF